MTRIEKEIMEKRNKYAKLANIAEKNIQRLKKDLQEESLNSYYADSWEQSAQISKRMEKIRQNISFLLDINRKLFVGRKISLSEISRFKKLCLRPYSFY